MNKMLNPVNDDGNPIDLVEDLASANTWRYNRVSDNDLQITIPSKWSELTMFVTWQDEFSALLIACQISSLQTPSELELAMSDLLQDINQKLWLGHFDLSEERKTPTFRYTCLMRHMDAVACLGNIEDVFDVTLDEIERFYPAIQMICAGQVHHNRETLSTAMLQPIGEA